MRQCSYLARAYGQDQFYHLDCFSDLKNQIILKIVAYEYYTNDTLASCQLGPVTANGVDLLTEIYVIYMERHPSVNWLLQERRRLTEGWKARKYIMMSTYKLHELVPPC